jgi:carbonic anhydrase
MRRFFIAVMLSVLAPQGFAANWVKLHETSGEKLMIDKQSILEVDKNKRAWMKITFTKPQVNEEVAEKTYNLSKMLWFFDCATQKAATAQVFQFSNDELIYSAAVDSKMAKFIEPVPETDIDIAMRYVCGVGASPELATGKQKPSADTEKVGKDDKSTEASEANPNADEKVAKQDVPTKDEPKAEKKERKSTENDKPTALDKAKLTETLTKAGDKSDKLAIMPITIPAHKAQSDSKVAWSYDDKQGPENWAKLTPDFALCESGKNQSPINIDNTIHAVMKPLKVFQRFPASSLINNGHALQINFNSGNILALDGNMYSLKQISFHAPSEHRIKGKSFPLEAEFLHEDPKGNKAMIAVLFDEGSASGVLSTLWKQIPLEVGSIKPLKGRVLASDFMPKAMSFYRYSGSVTAPPCSEGVSWVVMKTPLTASKVQIEALKGAMRQENNRPLQEINGRAVLE